VIIDDLNVMGIGLFPGETHSELAIDPNAMLSLPVAAQGFQVMARNCGQVLQGFGVVEREEALPGRVLDGLILPGELILE
jgi:hypothetical protein